MGYFANGSEGDLYEARYCARCVHNEDDPEKPGCPVMLVHVLYAYEECNAKSNAAHMLEELIPRKGAFNGQCAMFMTADTVRRKRADRRQLPMFEEAKRP